MSPLKLFGDLLNNLTNFEVYRENMKRKVNAPHSSDYILLRKIYGVQYTDFLISDEIYITQTTKNKKIKGQGKQ